MRQLLEFERYILTQAMRANGMDWNIGHILVVHECHHGTAMPRQKYVNRGFYIDFAQHIPEKVRFLLLPVKKEILGDYIACVVDPSTGQPVRMEAVSGPGIPETEFAMQARRVNTALTKAKQPTIKELQHRRFFVSNDDVAFLATNAPDEEISKLTQLDAMCVVESGKARIWTRIGATGHVLLDGVVSGSAKAQLSE